METMKEGSSSRTAVIIVNWNGEAFLEAAIHSVQQEPPAEIIVVDNASSDRSLAILGQYSAIKVISNKENLGFGAAANQGIAASISPYVMTLNVDVQLMSGTLQKLEQFMDANPAVAVAAPQLLFSDGRLQPSCRTFPSILKKFFFLSYLDRVIPTGYCLSAKNHAKTGEVDQPMGAAIMFRKKALEEVGCFDTDFFLYMEEVDLCERIKRGGWKIFYIAEAKAIHHAGGSSSQDWERTQTDYFRSVIRYFRKRVPGGKVPFLRISIACALIIRALVLLLTGKWRKATFYLRISPQILIL